jgi:hypothetical protein
MVIHSFHPPRRPDRDQQARQTPKCVKVLFAYFSRTGNRLARPKRPTAGSGTSAGPPLASAVSRTTSRNPSTSPTDSDPCYPLNSDKSNCY